MRINKKIILFFIATILSFSHSAFAQTPISCGQVIADSISVAGEQDSYTFTAQANDAVTIRASKTSGDLYPYLELYAPGGGKIANASSVIDKVLTIAGTYTIIVKDQYGSNTGDYCVTWQRISNPCSPVINCGQNTNGTIGTTVSQPPWLFYYFDAQANDKITIRSTKTSGGLYAYLELYAPDGTNLVKASGKIDRTLTIAGRYTIVVRDQYSSYTGDFCLIWMRLHNPCSTVLNCNQAAAGSITTNERFKFYSFSAQANDSVTIRNIKTSGDLYAYLELYSPDGTNLGSAANVIDRTLPVTGTYTIIARDQYNNYLGDFIVLWQKINNPCDSTALACSQTLTGTIGTTVSQPPWQFYYLDVTVNDKISIRAAKTSGGLYPYIELYAPDGANLGGASGQLDKTLTATGRYVILVRDQYNTYTGNFAITWQKLNNPCNAINIAFGQSTSGNIDSYPKIIAYKFTANANDKIYIAFAKLTETAGYFNPYLELYDSSGTKITSTTSSGAFIATIPAAGEYSLFVADTSRDGTGTYELTLQRSNNPANVEVLNYNTLIEDSLEIVTGINVYSFTANISDVITICSSVKTTTSGYFGTYLELFNSSGTRLAYSSSSLKYTFTAGGTFYLFVTDNGRDGTGIYRLKLLSGDFTCSSIDFVEPQVSLTQPRGGDVIEADSPYTITWTSTDNVGVTSQEIRLSTDSGLTYPTVIASGLASSVQSYDWQVPQDLSTSKGRIKVICLDAAANIGKDESSSDFSVLKTTLPLDAKNIGYEYDKLNRLTRSTAEEGIENNYSYDALGNRLTLDTTAAQLTPDFDHDGDVDWADFAVFVASWLKQNGQPGYDPRCDFNNDGIVNFKDYATFANEWSPRPPAGLGAKAVSYSQIDLSWEDNSDGESGFKIERKMGAEGTYGQITTVGQNATTYSDTGLAAEETYYYRLRAYGTTFGSTTSGYSSQASATTPPLNQPPILSSIGNKTVDEVQRLEFTISATDADSDELTYAAENLPEGATFSNQAFSWAPTYEQAGEYQVTFKVSDGQLEDAETITITVNNVNRPPVLASIGNKVINEGQLLEFTVSASDPDGDALIYSAEGLPQGTSFTIAPYQTGYGCIERLFSWTPTYEQAGEYQVTFKVSDGQLEDVETITIEVYGIPYIIAIFPTSGGPGRYVSILGKKFSTRNSLSRVKFSGPGGSKRIQRDAWVLIWSGSYSRIICRVPDIKPGIYRVTVINQAGESNSKFFVVRPK